MFAPANTPVAIADKLNAAIVQGTRQPDARKKFEEAGLRVTGTSRDEFGRFLKDDAARWGRVVRVTGFKAAE